MGLQANLRPPPPEVGPGEAMAELAVPRGSSARLALFQLRPLGAFYNDVNNIASLSTFDHQRYPPVGVEIPMAHGTACRSRALQLERNMTVQYL